MRVFCFAVSAALAMLICRPPAGAQEASEPPAPGADVPNLDEVVNPVVEAGKVAARDRKEMLRELRKKPLEQRAAMAKSNALSVRGDLLFGPTRAKYEVREQHLEAARLESLAAVESCEERMRVTRAELEAEASKIRERLADDSVERNRQLLLLIALYRPDLERLEREIEIHRSDVAQSSDELRQVRRQLDELAYRRRADEMRVKQASDVGPFRNGESPTPPAGLRDDLGPSREDQEGSASNGNSPGDSLPTDAEEQLKKLLERKP